MSSHLFFICSATSGCLDVSAEKLCPALGYYSGEKRDKGGGPFLQVLCWLNGDIISATGSAICHILRRKWYSCFRVGCETVG